MTVVPRHGSTLGVCYKVQPCLRAAACLTGQGPGVTLLSRDAAVTQLAAGSGAPCAVTRPACARLCRQPICPCWFTVRARALTPKLPPGEHWQLTAAPQWTPAAYTRTPLCHRPAPPGCDTPASLSPPGIQERPHPSSPWSLTPCFTGSLRSSVGRSCLGFGLRHTAPCSQQICRVTAERVFLDQAGQHSASGKGPQG